MPEQPPAYRRIADDLRAKIRGGVYAPGSELPILADLMREYGVGARNTVRDALAILKTEGLIDSGGGRRTRVSDPLPEVKLSEAEQMRADIAELQEQVRRLEERLAGHQDLRPDLGHGDGLGA